MTTSQLQTISRVSFLDILKPHVSKENLQNIEDAYTLSKYGHRNQLRDQGTRYFEHPKSVALILMNELHIYEPEMIAMALLHDIVEDTFILSKYGLEKLFGKRVILGLEYLTKTGSAEEYVEKLQECDDIGVIIIKFADRLHNSRDLDSVREEKKIRKIKETRLLYLPLLEKKIESAENKSDKNALLYLQKELLKVLG